MAHYPANQPGLTDFPLPLKAKVKRAANDRKNMYRSFVLLAAAILLAPLILAQDPTQVTGVDPTSGKVNDSVTVNGTNLGKNSVSAVFLSDDKDDFKATIVEQTEGKIVVKVPQVKAGSYNVSIQVGDKILIKPVRFTVEG